MSSAQIRNRNREQNPIENPNDHVCFGADLGCFYIHYPFKHVGLLPEHPQYINTRFFVMDPRKIYKTHHHHSTNKADESSTTESTEESHGPPQGLKAFEIDYNATSPEESWTFVNKESHVAFIIHGFNGKSTMKELVDLGLAMVEHTNAVVVMVDWDRGARYPWYEQAVVNMQVVARSLALLIERMRGFRKLNTDYVHLIGFSLGAHVAGLAGRFAQERFHYQYGRITALDPAWPLMEGYDTHVSAKDARFVDAIHTSAGDRILLGQMGMQHPVGHVDFYPNGGRVPQPHCHLQPLLHPIDCSHNSAIVYFQASLFPNCNFDSLPCGSWAEYRYHRCVPSRFKTKTTAHDPATNVPSRMGYHCEEYKGRGSQYLITSANYPHCYPYANDERGRRQ